MDKYNFESSNAFIEIFNIPAIKSGPLDGLTFAVKDNIDIAGFKTSYGSLPWLNTHPPAVSHAACVEQLLIAGATCVGKTISDELTCSLDGENHFYGTPVNAKSPKRVPGGSSSGSASAVACDLVDFSIGTDSAGSTRVPASNCGIIGFRPTTHRISESGILPFAPSSSTVSVFAKNLSVLQSVTQILLSSYSTPQPPVKKIYLLEDAFSIATEETKNTLYKYISKLKKIRNHTVSSITLAEIIGKNTNLQSWQEDIFSPIQCVEIWNAVGAWVEDQKPKMGARVQDAMGYFKQLDRTELNKALCMKEKMFHLVSNFLKPGELFCFPTTPMVAPFKGELNDIEHCKNYYQQVMSITSFSGVSALPEVTLPVASIDEAPLGISFAAATRMDEFLLSAVDSLFLKSTH